MGVVTSYGTRGTETGITMTDRFYRPDGTLPPVIWGHGFNGTGLGEVTLADNGRVMRALAKFFPLISNDLGGVSTWGNDTSIAKVEDARAYAQSSLGGKAGKVFLWGGSMGTLSVLNWAKANLSKVRAIALALPAVNLVDLHDNRGVGTSIENAYTNLAGYTAAAPAHDPTQNAGSFTSIPIKMWFSSDDTTVVPSVVTNFASVVNSLGGNVQTVNIGPNGHAITSLVESEVVSFFRQYA